MLPTFSYGDAIGNHVLEIREILRKAGYHSEIFCYNHDPRLAAEARYFAELEGSMGPQDIIIYHYSLSSPLSILYKELSSKKLLIYHNVTPYHFFYDTNVALAKECYMGRRFLPDLAPFTELALGDSSYNEAELKDAGFKKTGVLPIIIDFKRLSRKPSPSYSHAFDDGKKNFLFVGRVINNKKFEDIIKIFYYYKKYYNKDSRLIFAGQYRGFERYYMALQELIGKLGLKDVIFTGHISFRELVSLYRKAHIFISMSEHEGFCVPIVEAFFFNVPVLAYNCCAVEETANGGGILFNKKDFPLLASLANEILEDKGFRDKILKSQKNALKRYEKKKIEKILLDYIGSL